MLTGYSTFKLSQKKLHNFSDFARKKFNVFREKKNINVLPARSKNIAQNSSFSGTFKLEQLMYLSIKKPASFLIL